jgi:poly(hydroxyalkanoate) depolymerase family esterase
MNIIPNALQQLLRNATRLTQAGRLGEATAAIQQALSGAAPATSAMPGAVAGEVLDGCVFEAEPVSPPTATQGASPGFHAGTHTHAGLTRAYKLYVPPGMAAQPRPLVVMLHGCTQDPDDFAAGTDMNARADALGFCVLYPAQAQDANPSRCWNWFKHNHQVRDRGETGFIADLTRTVMRQCGSAPRQVYIAGLSAGGAMAALVAAAYPELFAAVGVHSGLAPGAANNLGDAMAAMQGKGAASASLKPLTVPLIVFHGDKDTTVSPRNGDQLIAAARSPEASPPQVVQGASSQGQRYTRRVYPADADHPAAEHWVLHGAGHAWSGGRPAGSYTDARGVDATGEMLRFFLAQPHA